MRSSAQTLRLYDTYANTVRTTFAHPAPLLDACFTDGSHAISGSLDQNVRYYDLNSNNDTVLGSHDNAVRSVVYSPEQGRPTPRPPRAPRRMPHGAHALRRP